MKDNSNKYLKYDDLKDDKSIRRDQKKQSKMEVDSAFLKQITKIQKERYDEKYSK